MRHPHCRLAAWLLLPLACLAATAGAQPASDTATVRLVRQVQPGVVSAAGIPSSATSVAVYAMTEFEETVATGTDSSRPFEVALQVPPLGTTRFDFYAEALTGGQVVACGVTPTTYTSQGGDRYAVNIPMTPCDARPQGRPAVIYSVYPPICIAEDPPGSTTLTTLTIEGRYLRNGSTVTLEHSVEAGASALTATGYGYSGVNGETQTPSIPDVITCQISPVQDATNPAGWWDLSLVGAGIQTEVVRALTLYHGPDPEIASITAVDLSLPEEDRAPATALRPALVAGVLGPNHSFNWELTVTGSGFTAGCRVVFQEEWEEYTWRKHWDVADEVAQDGTWLKCHFQSPLPDWVPYYSEGSYLLCARPNDVKVTIDPGTAQEWTTDPPLVDGFTVLHAHPLFTSPSMYPSEHPYTEDECVLNMWPSGVELVSRL